MEDQDRRQSERFARVYDFGTTAAEAANTDAHQNNAKLNTKPRTKSSAPSSNRDE